MARRNLPIPREFDCFGKVVGKYVSTSYTGEVIQCAKHGYAHLYPIPSGIDLYYAEDKFYQTHSSLEFLHKDVVEYQNNLWDTSYSFQTCLLDKYLPLVDVGCGTGTFVHFWNRHVNHGYGIEPSQLARSVSPAQKYIYEKIEDFPNIGNFDCNVRLSLVLEHVSDPLKMIKQYMQVMNKGKLMIVVPNEFNRLQKLVGGSWFISPVHCNYFTPRSLSHLVYQAGLRPVYITTTFPMEIFLLFGLNYRKYPNLGKKLHLSRLRLERFVGERMFSFYHSLYEHFGIGREIILVAEQPDA